jgi:hypothetical protein
MIYSPYSRVVELLVEHGAEINRTAYDYSGSVFYGFARVEALHFGLKNPRSLSQSPKPLKNRLFPDLCPVPFRDPNWIHSGTS